MSLESRLDKIQKKISSGVCWVKYGTDPRAEIIIRYKGFDGKYCYQNQYGLTCCLSLLEGGTYCMIEGEPMPIEFVLESGPEELMRWLKNHISEYKIL